MNWGKGLAIGMLVFVTFIITLTSIMMSKSTDLESEDYYQREVHYEQEIQAEKNALLFEKISMKQDESFLIFMIPDSLEAFNAKVLLTRPNNEKLDRLIEFNQSKSLLIPIKELEKGNYKVILTYKVDDKDCMVKTTVNI